MVRTRAQSKKDIEVEQEQSESKKRKTGATSEAVSISEPVTIQKVTHKVEKEIPQVLEQGHIFFFYRPKIDVVKPKSIDDVQKMYMIMKPFGMDKKPGKKARLIIIPKKCLPRTEAHEQHFAIIGKVSEDIKDISKELQEETHETKTRGERTTPKAMPIGEGIYHIAMHGHRSKEHSHLVYSLVLPKRVGKVQKEFHIKREGSFIIQVKVFKCKILMF